MRLKMPIEKGRLVCVILEAKDLPDTDTFFGACKKDVTDPYVVGEIERQVANPFRLFKTKVIDNSLTPVWNETFTIIVHIVHHKSEHITIRVKDKDMVGADDFVGSCKVACDLILPGDEIKAWYQLENKGKKHGKIHMSIQYTPETKGTE